MSKSNQLTPKVFIISHFDAEAQPWLSRTEPFAFTRTIKVSGLSAEYPVVHCTSDGDVCLLTTGMGQINAALALSALTSSSLFDLRSTYFLIAGIGGVNPEVGTLGSVVLGKYAIQVDMQYQIDARELPKTWTTGYFPQGATSPSEPPTTTYGTEVLQVDEALRDRAFEWAKKADLLDDPAAREYCQLYDPPVAKLGPTVLKADITCSNVFFHGPLLSKSFSDTCEIFVKHFAHQEDAIYGITAQEDSGTLAALYRSDIDKSRIIMMRTASNFDQPPHGQEIEVPIHWGHGGFKLGVENIYRAGVEIVKGVLEGWEGVDVGLL